MIIWTVHFINSSLSNSTNMLLNFSDLLYLNEWQPHMKKIETFALHYTIHHCCGQSTTNCVSLLNEPGAHYLLVASLLKAMVKFMINTETDSHHHSLTVLIKLLSFFLNHEDCNLRHNHPLKKQNLLLQIRPYQFNFMLLRPDWPKIWQMSFNNDSLRTLIPR